MPAGMRAFLFVACPQHSEFFTSFHRLFPSSAEDKKRTPPLAERSSSFYTACFTSDQKEPSVLVYCHWLWLTPLQLALAVVLPAQPPLSRPSDQKPIRAMPCCLAKFTTC